MEEQPNEKQANIITYYNQYQRYLISVAYRLLGSLADAEDIVQEVFAIATNHDWENIINVKAYLTKITTNRSLNLLQSSHRQREHYLGPWLPEPMLDEVSEQPEQIAEKRDNIRYAMLVLLQSLTPQERAVYILRDSLGFDYNDIAHMMDRTESNCRKIFSRAKQKIGHIPAEMSDESNVHSETIVKLFIEAIEEGNFQKLAQQLLHDVTLITDGGGKTKAALKPIFGRDRVLAFLQGIREKGAFEGKIIPASLNSETGLILSRQHRNVLTLHFGLDTDGRIENIYIVLNPEKLHALHNIS